MRPIHALLALECSTIGLPRHATCTEEGAGGKAGQGRACGGDEPKHRRHSLLTWVQTHFTQQSTKRGFPSHTHQITTTSRWTNTHQITTTHIRLPPRAGGNPQMTNGHTRLQLTAEEGRRVAHGSTAAYTVILVWRQIPSLIMSGTHPVQLLLQPPTTWYLILRMLQPPTTTQSRPLLLLQPPLVPAYHCCCYSPH